MSKLSKLEQKVTELYERKDPARDEWADWFWAIHVRLVADFASELARKYKVDVDQARAAALLHDIADTVMGRFKPDHEEKSLQIARELLIDAGYNKEAIKIIINDALRYHSCHGDQAPSSGVGKILATADALAHFESEFYSGYEQNMRNENRWTAESKQRALQKIDRDYYKKIFYDEVRDRVKPRYEKLKSHFSAQTDTI
jgi:putative nucleotidyltransferase with HDIG domain